MPQTSRLSIPNFKSALNFPTATNSMSPMTLSSHGRMKSTGSVPHTLRTQYGWSKLGLDGVMPGVPTNERQRLADFIGSDYVRELITEKHGRSSLTQESRLRQRFLDQLKAKTSQHENYFSQGNLMSDIEHLQKDIEDEGVKSKLLKYNPSRTPSRFNIPDAERMGFPGSRVPNHGKRPSESRLRGEANSSRGYSKANGFSARRK